MPRDGAIIFADLIGKLDTPYKSGPSKAWLKIKNPKAPAATRVVDGNILGRERKSSDRLGPLFIYADADIATPLPGLRALLNRVVRNAL
jgi:hypothetical protein